MRLFKFFFSVQPCSFSITNPHSEDIGELRYIFPSDNGQETILALLDIKEMYNDTIVHQGIKAEIISSGIGLTEALTEAEGRLDYVLSLVLFELNVVSVRPQLQFGYEISNNSLTSEFIQIEYIEDPLLKQKRNLYEREPRLRKLVNKVLAEQAFPEISPYIIRAVKKYHSGLFRTDPIDTFLDFWVGLEVLNPLLIKHFKASSFEISKCPNTECGYERQVPATTGVKALFEEFSTHKTKDYSNYRGLRSGLEHGGKHLAGARKLAEEYNPNCQTMLRKAIYILLSLDENNDDPINNACKKCIVYKGNFLVPASSLAKLSEPPRLAIKSNISLLQWDSVSDEREINIVLEHSSQIECEIIQMIINNGAGSKTQSFESKSVDRNGWVPLGQKRNTNNDDTRTS